MHSCPDCGVYCHCGGDIDDIDFGDTSPHADNCTHFEECQLEENDDDGYPSEED